MLGGGIKAIEVVPFVIDLSDAEPVVMQVADEGIFQFGVVLRCLSVRGVECDHLQVPHLESFLENLDEGHV